MEIPPSFPKESSHPPTECCHGYEDLPEEFSDWPSYIKVIGIGLAITILQFLFLVVIIAKPWQ
jgi:hypothetical protein